MSSFINDKATESGGQLMTGEEEMNHLDTQSVD